MSLKEGLGKLRIQDQRAVGREVESGPDSGLLKASEEVEFEGEEREEIYGWISETLRSHSYGRFRRTERDLLRSYIAKLTGLSRAQRTRLISRYLECGAVKTPAYQRHRFTARYSRADIELLAAVDEAHDNTLSGPATKRILEREYAEYGKKEYQRLAGISVAHLYNLRKQSHYRNGGCTIQKRAPRLSTLGNGDGLSRKESPGICAWIPCIRAVRMGIKGVYHINAVDEITQWLVMACVPQISEALLLPTLALMLREFPFEIRGFHSDNGSEYINHTVARLLNKLLTEQTKSRPRHSNDNGLVETKNGVAIRKHMGYGHIAAGNAEAISRFYREHLNRYAICIGPCAQADFEINAKHKKRPYYRRYQTPLETLLALESVEQFLRAGQPVHQLR